ncbi:DsbA family oxidoreductase [Brevibacillus ginsengisoli]|uniref:DsbA family oxidoreductase n=1 Tax=Brevibacillus ginsengisoli TaxID=363854 RepID=UPI003CF1BE10
MKVEIWSDFACPFCYIGKRRFEAALEQFPHKEAIEVVYRSFELDPYAARDVDYDVHDMVSSKYGMTRQQALEMNQNIALQAKAVGLDFQFDTTILTNTFDAHRLAQYAATKGKAREMTELLLKGYFTDSKHLSDHETLTALAAEAGLDPNEAAGILNTEEYAENVRADEAQAAELGIRGVPFFVVDRKYAISGAQPVEAFLETLQKAWDEHQPLTILHASNNDSIDAACIDGVCTPPAKK